MREITKNLAVHHPVLGVALVAMVLMSSACGNKGDLFLDGRDLLLDTKPPEPMPSIDDALDELEVLEAEEAVPSSNALEEALPENNTLLNGDKPKE